MITVRAPGRVNLIGDHTDYTGGLVMPMAIDRWTTIECEPSAQIDLTSAAGDAQPYIAAVAAELGSACRPVRGEIRTSIPIGAGLSSSAALEVTLALALGFQGSGLSLAELTQRAEHRATGVPTGIMDQLCIASGKEGHALRIDCARLTVTPVALPVDVDVHVRLVGARQLASSAYAERVAQCRAAEDIVGPLHALTRERLDRISDPVIRKRARHVVTENERVDAFAEALTTGQIVRAGHLMLQSHASLRDDFEVSTPEMDAAVAEIARIPGVLGARMTGGGFGGCVVALAERGTNVPGWIVHAVDGASRRDTEPGGSWG